MDAAVGAAFCWLLGGAYVFWGLEWQAAVLSLVAVLVSASAWFGRIQGASASGSVRTSGAGKGS